ncbi:hypothetical protein COO91_04244 [Nostoc flagelliforme CCNUN1]|uniref:Uncharacterized protein n=1 Tax=Nostoc flagelliforme CCNUN1 TaxID=2038116 RepID=A0A2K8SS41_9NOSO|nr:hypothetical protein COO91_04244 [Nostoc flagelliforme CCNUN1]
MPKFLILGFAIKNCSCLLLARAVFNFRRRDEITTVSAKDY